MINYISSRAIHSTDDNLIEIVNNLQQTYRDSKFLGHTESVIPFHCKIFAEI